MQSTPPIPTASLGPSAPTGTDNPPFTKAELVAAIRHPATAIDVLLAQRQRWAATVVADQQRGPMAAVQLLWSFAFSLPYALVLAPQRPFHVAALYLGSVAICLPSLHVVSAYVGLRIEVAQTFAFATIGATVAAIFSLGFAPILWFLRATIDKARGADDIALLSVCLLSAAALAGAAHTMRCLALTRRLDRGSGIGPIVVLWHLLLLFITYRMGRSLGLI